MTKPDKPIQAIPMAYVMAFDAVSVKAYVGAAAGLRVDCTLDGDDDMELVVMAKDTETLSRFYAHIGHVLDEKKVEKVAVASTATLRIFPISKFQPKPPEDEL